MRIVLCLLSLFFLQGCIDPRSPREKFRDHILDQFSKQMQKKGLYAIGQGGGCTTEGKINLIDIVFDYRVVMDVESARKLIVEGANDLLNLINSDTKNRGYFEVFPVNVSIISMSILSYVPAESSTKINMVSLLQGNIFYCKKDPEKKIMPFINVHVETFDEAQKKLGSNKVSNPPQLVSVNLEAEISCDEAACLIL